MRVWGRSPIAFGSSTASSLFFENSAGMLAPAVSAPSTIRNRKWTRLEAWSVNVGFIQAI